VLESGKVPNWLQSVNCKQKVLVTPTDAS